MADTAGLFQLGIDLAETPSSAQTEAAEILEFSTERRAQAQPQAQWTSSSDDNDHFIVRNGRVYAGEHLIIDLWGASRLDDIEHIEETLTRAVKEAGATLLHIHLHHFTPNGGVSGVAVLAESHISIHTWPERNYAALDVFMCGDSQPVKTIPILRDAFTPDRVVVDEFYRGEVGK
jgi:S-adenosylmethionine decarboxylase